MPNLLQKVFGSHNDRVLKKIFPLVDRINQLEAEYVSFSDEALRARTAAYRQRVENGEPLEDLLPEAFASVRAASATTTSSWSVAWCCTAGSSRR
jgi:preprotein translocase subunit SecA